MLSIKRSDWTASPGTVLDSVVVPLRSGIAKRNDKMEFVNRIAMGACMQDWCFQRMRKVMPLKESEILTHEALVDRFLSKYICIERSHLLSLKSVADRRSLNAIIHLSYDNEEDIKLIRDMMSETLSN